MNLEHGATHEILGEVDYRPLRDFILNLPKESWNKNTIRQKLFSVHKDTESIIFRFTPDFDDPTYKTDELWDDAGEALSNIINSVLSYRSGEIIRCIAPMLPAGKKIDKHVDSSMTLEKCHRIHIPLITNNNVEFIINGERIPMKEGVAVEINNIAEHSVFNNSNKDRLHLIVDVF